MTNGGRPRTLLLVGTAYCGSTHVGGLVEANLDAVYAGEVSRLPRFVEEYGLDQDTAPCLVCEDSDVPCPLWSPEAMEEAEEAGPWGALEVVRRRSDASIVVDGSKWPAWTRVLGADRPAEAIRPVVAVVARSPLRYVVSATGLLGAAPWLVAQWWRDTYADAVRTITRTGIPHVVIRNEDVRRDPLAAVASIATLVGDDVPEHLAEPALTHGLGGNPWVQRGYHLSVIERWRAEAGFDDDVDLPPGDRPIWAEMSAQASASLLYGPRTRDDALMVAQAVNDCPGLVELAQFLGYAMAREVAEFVDAVPDEPADDLRAAADDSAGNGGVGDGGEYGCVAGASTGHPVGSGCPELVDPSGWRRPELVDSAG